MTFVLCRKALVISQIVELTLRRNSAASTSMKKEKTAKAEVLSKSKALKLTPLNHLTSKKRQALLLQEASFISN